MEITNYSDAGHSWYAIEKSFLKDHNLLSKISNYSYERQGIVYLEEDCDASHLFKTLKELNIKPIVKEVYEHNSQVRNYNSFRG